MKSTDGFLLLGAGVAVFLLRPMLHAQADDPCSTVECVCETECAANANECADGVANIYCETSIAGNAILDFEASDYPDVNVKGGGSLTLAERHHMTIFVHDLVVEEGGLIDAHDKCAIHVDAKNKIWVLSGGTVEAVGKGRKHLAVTVDLHANHHVLIQGTVRAKGTGTFGQGGRLHIWTTSNKGRVEILDRGTVRSYGKDPGSCEILVESCRIKVTGTVDGSCKKRGTYVTLVAREELEVDGGKVLAKLEEGLRSPGERHRLALVARRVLKLTGAEIVADSGTTNKRGGHIAILSRGLIEIDGASEITANALAAGGDGGEVEIRAIDSVAFAGDVAARGNTASGNAGIFGGQGNAFGTSSGTVDARGGKSDGSCKVCAVSVDSPAFVGCTPEASACEDLSADRICEYLGLDRYCLAPCDHCPCLEGFDPYRGRVGTEITLTGHALDYVTKVLFNNEDCDRNKGTPVLEEDFISRSEGEGCGASEIRLEVPALDPGEYFVILVNPSTGSFCSSNTFEVMD
jgi:hypothetical protein